jgi:hypothetical protein
VTIVGRGLAAILVGAGLSAHRRALVEVVQA